MPKLKVQINDKVQSRKRFDPFLIGNYQCVPKKIVHYVLGKEEVH
jgi:hypothetical protein